MRLSIVELDFFDQPVCVPKKNSVTTSPPATASKRGRAPKGVAVPTAITNEPAHDAAVCGEHHHHPEVLALKPLALQEAQEMAGFFAALADPTRLRLISLLAAEDCCVCDLAQQLGMTDSAISHQLRTLRAARLVRYRKEGRQVFYRLHDHHVVELYRTVQEHLAE